MIAELREDFNKRFTPAKYAQMQRALEEQLGARLGFRVAETPCFFPKELLDRCATIGAELTHRLVDDPAYLAAASEAIPAAYRAAGASAHPHFMTADFGLVREPDGRLAPRLVELQAFPSVYGYQVALCEAYRSAYELAQELGFFLGGHTDESFWDLLGRTILNGHAPEHVVLIDVAPWQQKTYPDFAATVAQLGIRVVDIAQLIIEREPGAAAKVFYEHGGEKIRVHRIYNRAIVDEIVDKQIELPFAYPEPLEVEWAGHPDWYFLISKFSLPYLEHPAVPPAVFLDRWLAGEKRGLEDRSALVFKPLFAFAGKGVEFAPSEAELLAVAPDERGSFLLQRRESFEPVIATPCGPTQAEIRILYLWPDGGSLEPVLSLTRLGRGEKMGVDQNRNQEWVGGSAAFYR